MADKSNDLLAFAGAEGFGAHADGGRGGKILKVTNLNDSGAGSLRWALEDQDGPRIVVFEVGGTIKLDDQIQINGDVTVAGQTAPGGVTITGGRLRVVESDVIIRGLHVRPGDGDGQKAGDRDGISVGKRGSTVEDVIIDSNSISWAVDESASAWGSPSHVTFSNNIFAEALRYSIHPEGRHSMGLLVGDGSSNVSVIDNLFAHNMFRNATVKDDAKQIEFVNNVIYNYGPNGFLGHEGVTAHIIGNVYIPGADSAGREAIRLQSPEGGTAYYLNDNVAEVSGPAMSKITNGEVFKPSNVTVLPSGKVVDHVLATAGARAPELDQVDSRIIASVKKGTGSIIDSPKEVGGMKFAAKTAALPDRDGDGIPDKYEAIIGSNPNKSDAHGDADGVGYDNIETYINGLLGGFKSKPAKSDDSPRIEPDPRPDPRPDPVTTVPEKVDPIRFDDGSARYEVEDFDLSRADGNGEQTAKTIFDGPSGIYDIAVDYFDESDGEAELTVKVDGKTVDHWDWDSDLGNKLATSETLVTRVIEGVRIDKGDAIVLTGLADGGEPLRIDAVELFVDMVFG